MRKPILFSVALTMIGLAAVGIYLIRGSAQAVTVRLNVKDLPEYGLILVAPSDQSFNGLITTPSQATEMLKPFSALLRNTGDRTVIAYQLKWELAGPDGRTSIRTHGFINLGKLKTAGYSESIAPTTEAAGASPQNAIKPGESVFCSPAGAIGVGQAAVGGEMGVVSTTPTREAGTPDEIKQVSQGNSDAQLSKLAGQLSQLSSITVSVDGVLFDDGAFVGPDTTNFFSRITGQFNAKTDLLQEMHGLVRAESTGEGIKHLEKIAGTPGPRVNHKSTPDDLYNYYKRRFAREVLRKYAARGPEAIEKELEVLTKPHFKPRKE